MPDLTPPALLRDGTPCPQALLTLPFETTRGQASLSDFLGHRLVLYFRRMTPRGAPLRRRTFQSYMQIF
jgi:hypothetical protein